MYKDCIARTERCNILKKMICKNNDCPFYKSKKQHDEDIKNILIVTAYQRNVADIVCMTNRLTS